jgi:hypothetical protein
MATLMVSCLIAWGTIVVYMAWLAIGDRRLRQRLGGLQCDFHSRPSAARTAA